MKFKYLALIPFLVGACTSPSSNSGSEDKSWDILFDGTSIENLRGYAINDFPEGVWTIEDGVLIANPDTLNRDLVTKARYQNFELAYEWAVDTAANSGVFFHVQEDLAMEDGNGNSPNWLDNFEIQVLDDLHFYDTVAVRSAGSLYDLIVPTGKELKPISEFNIAKLKHDNGIVEHWLNGQKVLDFVIGSPELNELVANSKFSENPAFHSDKEGHIMFQHHGQRVYYKNIRIREL